MDSSASPNSDLRNSLGLVIPLYNEEAVVPMLIASVEAFRLRRPFVTEVVLVDDGSTDRTAALVREQTRDLPGYTLVQFSRNFGHQLAITAGLAATAADAAVVLDADLQDPLEVIDEMVVRWQSGYDVVYGIRRRREGDSWLGRTLSASFYRIFQRLADSDTPVDVGDFRLMSREVIDAFTRLEERQPYVRGLVSWLGFNQTGVEYDRPARVVGRSKYPFRKRVELAFNSIVAFSDKPLRYAARLGFLVSVFSVLGIIWTVLAKIFKPEVVSGWASLIFTAFFFGGLQLFFLGIVGAYLARVYDEVKSRPRYVISRQWNSDSTPPRDRVTATDNTKSAATNN
jgi:dolichol-phosphate mannosyltransferase